MSRMWMWICLGIVVLLLTGCTPSLNQQRSLARSGADITVTTYLGTVNREILEVRRDDLLIWTYAVMDFLAEGEVSELPISKFREAILGLTPDDYRIFMERILGSIHPFEVDIAGVGARNLARMKAVTRGLEVGIIEFQ